MPALSHANFEKPTGVGYPTAAVQSVSVTTQTPRNPLSALGYKGIVGFIKQPDTADVTVEEFLPADVKLWTSATGVAASGFATFNISDIAVADDENPTGTAIAGAIGCVLTGVTFSFVAGQPCRVSWNYLGKGGLASLDSTTPITGTGEEKTVLLWENVNIANNSLQGYLTYPVSGVQSATFTGTINKDTLFALGTSGVYQHVTTFPTNVSVTLESFEPLTSSVAASGNIAIGPVRAINCRQSSRGESVSVGGFRTNTEAYTAANLEFYLQP